MVYIMIILIRIPSRGCYRWLSYRRWRLSARDWSHDDPIMIATQFTSVGRAGAPTRTRALGRISVGTATTAKRSFKMELGG